MSDPFVGEIRLFAFGRTPIGWQACDGSLLVIAENDVLFTLIGTTYGGDGQTTFAVPDLRGRVPLHQGQGPALSNRTIGERAGSESVTLTTPQLPIHNHALLTTTAAATSLTPGSTLLPGAVSNDLFYVSDITGATAMVMAPASTGQSGNSQAHDNTMPTLTVQYCIATQGIFPQQT